MKTSLNSLGQSFLPPHYAPRAYCRQLLWPRGLHGLQPFLHIYLLVIIKILKQPSLFIFISLVSRPLYGRQEVLSKCLSNGWMDGWMDEWMNEWMNRNCKGTWKQGGLSIKWSCGITKVMKVCHCRHVGQSQSQTRSSVLITNVLEGSLRWWEGWPSSF